MWWWIEILSLLLLLWACRLRRLDKYDGYVDMEPDKHTYDKAMESGDVPDEAKKK